MGLLSAELDEVKNKLAEVGECEIEIKELQVQLNPAKSKSAEQVNVNIVTFHNLATIIFFVCQRTLLSILV